MRLFLRWYAVGFVLVFFVSCQSKVASIPSEARLEMPSLSTLFFQLEERQTSIRDVKAFVRTKISGRRLNRTFRQALLVRGNETIRVDTYNLFHQVIGVLICDREKTLMYDPRGNRIVFGEEAWDIMRQVVGTHIDFREYISVFSGGIPRFSHLHAKVSKWNADQTIYQVETVDSETGEQVNIEIDAHTLMPRSVLLIRGTQEIYRVYWNDYRKVDKWDFAHEIVIEFKAENETVTLKYSDLFINQGFDPDVFEFVSEWMN